MIADEELITRFAGYGVDRDTAAHFRGRLQRQLLINRCGSCGRWHHPPRPVCPDCWSTDISAQPVTGTGTIHLAIFLHQGPPAPGVDYSTPYPVVDGRAGRAARAAFLRHRDRRRQRRDRHRPAGRARLDRARRRPGAGVPAGGTGMITTSQPDARTRSPSPARRRPDSSPPTPSAARRRSPPRRAPRCCASAGSPRRTSTASAVRLRRRPYVQAMLGIPEVTWFANPAIPFVNHVAAAVGAVARGLCETVLAYHAAYRLPWNTGSAWKDPFRRTARRRPAAAQRRRTARRRPSATRPGRRATCTSSTYPSEHFGLRRHQRPLERGRQPGGGDARADDDGRLSRRPA